jgi:hypothetical protein
MMTGYGYCKILVNRIYSGAIRVGNLFFYNLLMKKILLAVTVSFFAAAIRGQTAAPRELTCTEQAITLKASLRSGWHLNTVQVGHPEMIKGLAGSEPGWVYHYDGIPGYGLPLAFEKAFKVSNSQLVNNTALLPDVMSIPLGGDHAMDRLNYIFGNNNKLLQIATFSPVSFIH